MTSSSTDSSSLDAKSNLTIEEIPVSMPVVKVEKALRSERTDNHTQLTSKPTNEKPDFRTIRLSLYGVISYIIIEPVDTSIHAPD